MTSCGFGMLEVAGIPLVKVHVCVMGDKQFKSVETGVILALLQTSSTGARAVRGFSATVTIRVAVEVPHWFETDNWMVYLPGFENLNSGCCEVALPVVKLQTPLPDWQGAPS